ncbi:hypothetical protein FACS1894178_7890 [Bacteroidia bacterium]|nr:hypothetical protein FACS1894178_7890 [Bacteroidia bacterium]
MKKLPLIILTTFITIQTFAQSSNQNYIRSRTYTSVIADSYIDEIQYFDGLGRPIETVQKGISPNGKDLVAFQEYDAFGRESKTWLPRPTNVSNGAFVDLNAFMSLSNDVYNGDAAPFTKTVYENSPLNRVLEQYGAGVNWHNNQKSVKTEYLTNNAQNPCRKFSVSTTAYPPTILTPTINSM